MADTLDAALSFVSAVPSSGSCTYAAPTISCSLADLSPLESASITVTTDVSPATPDGSTLPNTASLTSTTPLTPASVVSATAAPTIATRADLVITKSAITNPAVPGRSVSWTVDVVNNGPSDAQAVAVNDAAPTGVTLTAAPGCTVLPTDVTCVTPTLSAGATTSFTITGTLDPSFAASSLTNLASATSTTSDPGGANIASVTVPVAASADVSIVKSRSPNTPALIGDIITWTVTVSNAGPSSAANVQWSDLLPPEVDALTAFGFPPPGWSCSTAGSVICTTPTLAPSDSATFTLSARVRSDVIANVVSNTAMVATDTSDPDLTNNSSELTAALIARADLSVTKTLDTSSLVAGRPVSWTVRVRNLGPSVARGATVSDSLPFPVNSVSSTQGVCTVATATCSLGDVAVGTTVVVTVAGVVPADYLSSRAPAVTATLTNTASATSLTVDPSPDNVAAASGTVTAEADVTIVKTTSAPTAVTAGTAMTYTIKVSNNGPSTAVAPTVDDPLPANFTPSATSFIGAGYSCAVDGANNLTCGLGDLPPGGVVSISVPGLISADALTGFSNTATVSSPTPDPASGSNTSTATNDVANEADLSVSKVVLTAGPLVAGRQVSWRIVVSNAGPSDAQQVVVTDVLPASIQSPSATSADSACTITAGTISCAAASLPTGDAIAIIVVGTIDPTTTATSIANTASVVATTPDLDLADNQSTTNSSITTSADLTITKRVVGGPYRNGDRVTFQITVSNDGPSAARDVRIVDSLPPGLTYVSITSADSDCDGTTLTCRVATLDSGSSIAVSVVATARIAGSLVNRASVTAATSDPGPASNSTSAAVDVAAVASITLTKTVNTANSKTGDNVIWTITVKNAGPDRAANVEVRDALPTGLVFLRAAPSTGAYSSATGTWTIGDLVAGATATLAVTTTTASPGRLTNIVTARWSECPALTAGCAGAAVNEVSAQATVTVVATGPSPRTGADSRGWMRTAAALMLLGAVLVFGSRRRRVTT